MEDNTDNELYRFEYNEHVANLFGQTYDKNGNYPNKVALVNIINGHREYFYFTDFASLLSKQIIKVVSDTLQSHKLMDILFNSQGLLDYTLENNIHTLTISILGENLKLSRVNSFRFSCKSESFIITQLFSDYVSSYVATKPIVLYAILKQLD